MYTNCDDVFKLTIPAVRVAVAKSLSNDYGMNQAEIAQRLGIAQAAVSKYLSNKYSRKIAALEKNIQQNRLERPIAKAIASKEDKKKVKLKIDRLASSENLVKTAMKVL